MRAEEGAGHGVLTRFVGVGDDDGEVAAARGNKLRAGERHRLGGGKGKRGRTTHLDWQTVSRHARRETLP